MTDISVCNQALALSGARSQIAAIDENSPEAHACRTYYDATRIEMLMAIPWPFARRQMALAQLDTAEVGWGYTYLYPTDCLKPIFIPPDPVEVPQTFTNLSTVRDALDNLIYFVEGNRVDGFGNIQRIISTDKAQARLVYVADVTNANIFSADYRAILTQALASKLVLALTGNLNASNLQNTIAQQLMGRAMQTYKDEYDKDRRPVVYDLLPLGLADRE
jgi:hypothetical protein